jgi:protein-disulfide isomerase
MLYNIRDERTGMLRISLRLLSTVISCSAALACNNELYSVSTCEPGQGYDLPDDPVPVLGTRGAPVSVALFGDVRCPHTAEMVLALAALVDDLEESGQTDALEVQFRHFPVLGTENLAAAAEAAHLESDEAFWEMYWCLFSMGGSDGEIVSFCADLMGFDEDELLETAASEPVQRAVTRDLAIARHIGFQGAPGMLLCGKWTLTSPERVVENVKALLPAE